MDDSKERKKNRLVRNRRQQCQQESSRTRSSEILYGVGVVFLLLSSEKEKSRDKAKGIMARMKKDRSTHTVRIASRGSWAEKRYDMPV